MNASRLRAFKENKFPNLFTTRVTPNNSTLVGILAFLSFVVVGFMNSCQVGEFKILYISYFSFVLYFSLFGSVKSNYGLFLISGIRLFHDGTLSITRTLMANLVDKDLHGTLFVIPGILQSIATSGGALTYSTLYKAGVINFLVII